MSTTKVPLRDSEEKTIGIVGISRDITTAKQAEDALQKGQVFYSQAERMGKLGYWEWDHIKDRLVSCSEQFARNYGMSVDEALEYFSKRESDVSVIHPDDRERYQQSSDDSEEQLEGMDIEFRIITRSGAVRMFIYRVRFC